MDGPRALRPAEVPALLRLCNLVFRSRGGDMGAEFDYYLNRRTAAAGHLRVMAHRGSPVAHCGYQLCEASVFGARLSLALVGAVCTHPDHRGKGLGTRLLRDCYRQMRREGADVCLISGGRGLYRRNGAIAAGRYLGCIVSPGGVAGDCRPAPARPADAPALAALYRAEPVRWLRSPADWREILAGRWCMNRPTKLWTVRRLGRPVAYAALRKPSGPARPGVPPLAVGEFAGCRRALAAALPAMVRRSGFGPAQLKVQEWDAPLLAELAARGLGRPKPVGEGGRTVRLVNPRRLLERLRPVLVERAGPAAGGLRAAAAGRKVRLALGRRSLELSGEDACALLFGTVEGAERRLLAGRGELSSVLAAALPVELPWYGFNYV